MNKPRISGFTLIELLIVVAIIGILAAIAVPNFISAQTRAKLARVKSDMLALSAALESYRVDHNHYPYFDDGSFPPRYNPIDYRLIPLSTPVAYISSVSLQDPFLEWSAQGYEDELFRNTYNYRNHEFFTVSAMPDFHPKAWVLNSMGPDGITNQGLQTEIWARSLVGPSAVTLYDPTNGAVSAGDIPRTGGETKFQPNF